MGVGVPAITVKNMSVPKLAEAILKLTTDKEMHAKAASLGEHIR